jgi:hypothetical protein
MSREANSVYVHPVALLPIARGSARTPLLYDNRYVVSRMHLRRALPWLTAISRYKRIQSDHADSGDVGVSSTDDAGTYIMYATS